MNEPATMLTFIPLIWAAQEAGAATAAEGARMLSDAGFITIDGDLDGKYELVLTPLGAAVGNGERHVKPGTLEVCEAQPDGAGPT